MKKLVYAMLLAVAAAIALPAAANAVAPPLVAFAPATLATPPAELLLVALNPESAAIGPAAATPTSSVLVLDFNINLTGYDVPLAATPSLAAKKAADIPAILASGGCHARDWLKVASVNGYSKGIQKVGIRRASVLSHRGHDVKVT